MDQILRGAAELPTLPSGASEMTLRQRIADEALVLLDDRRPSLMFAGDRLERREGVATVWPQLLDDAVISGLEAVARLVALVRYGDYKIGTALLVGDRLLMTNQHVLDELDQEAVEAGLVTIDFGDGTEDTHRYVVTGSVPSPLWLAARTIDPSRNLDVAFLRLEVSIVSRGVLSISTAEELADAQEPLAVIGFPIARPGDQTCLILEAIFGEAEFGRKRLSPGLIMIPPYAPLPIRLAPHGDAHGWVFAHDAATTRGSSGSCIVSLATEGPRLFGLHFGGQESVANVAYRLGNRHVRDLLQPHPLTWGT